MLRISPIDAPPATSSTNPGWPLFNTTATRQLEQISAQHLPPHTLMERAGKAIAQLAMALTPYAQRIWIACGPGNNGGDGFEAAAELKRRLPHLQVMVSEVCSPAQLPPDARLAREKAEQAGVQWQDALPPELQPQDLCIDALLGIGLRVATQARSTDQRLRQLLTHVQQCTCAVLCVDVASGLDADTGQYLPRFAPGHTSHHQLRHTLALLTLQPGLFTAQGRDACGQIWWDDLGCGISHAQTSSLSYSTPADAIPPSPSAYLVCGGHMHQSPRPHNSHKGSYGDVAVLGGQGLSHGGISMTGAAWLAALAALHAGAGRVMLALLDETAPQGIAPWPEIMLRRPSAQNWSQATVVCGCGGGDAVQEWLPQILAQAPQLVLDADALNAIAASPALTAQLRQRHLQQQSTILTPHPLEAARLLKTTTTEIQANRLQSCLQLADQLQCTVLLKGSGTVIANPQQQVWVNASGNARLATGGTGDVLAGLIAALWAQGLDADAAASQGAFRHGRIADEWPSNRAFSASALAQALGTLALPRP